MYQNTSAEKFATLFYCILDTRSHWLHYSNAGHNYPIIFSQGEKKCALESNGLVLGCMESANFDEDQLVISPGDLLLLYSDGVTEAMNKDEEEFGEIRLMDVIKQYWQEPSQTIVDKILEQVQMFSHDSPQIDDMTLLVLKRLA
jgi:sigma-B regulation protein RsbU (phosphoserine phosphatase)